MSSKTLANAPPLPVPSVITDARKLTAQLRAAERDAAKARGELRSLKASQSTAVAQAEAKVTLLEQQLKKTNAKVAQVTKQAKGEETPKKIQKNNR
jgi:hypothetical protein